MNGANVDREVDITGKSHKLPGVYSWGRPRAGILIITSFALLGTGHIGLLRNFEACHQMVQMLTLGVGTTDKRYKLPGFYAWRPRQAGISMFVTMS